MLFIRHQYILIPIHIVINFSDRYLPLEVKSLPVKWVKSFDDPRSTIISFLGKILVLTQNRKFGIRALRFPKIGKSVAFQVMMKLLQLVSFQISVVEKEYFLTR